MRDQLVPVADTKHRHALCEQPRINVRAPGFIHTRRPSGNDDALARAQFFRWRLARLHIGEHAQLAHLPRNQMRVLAASVEYGDLRGWSTRRRKPAFE